jgi:phosphoribosylglycinamide formyltransferase-1
MMHIAVFASGAGSNTRKIIDYFRHHATVAVSLVVSNQPAAGVLQIAREEGIASLIIEKERFMQGDAYVAELRQRHIGFIVLAGFLWKVPPALVAAYPRGIINIHPALLPKYGGKGMYGRKVHEAVLANGEKDSGITIHYVDELYDHGTIIYQASCAVTADDTPDTLAGKIHLLEHTSYPLVIEKTVQLQNHR